MEKKSKCNRRVNRPGSATLSGNPKRVVKYLQGYYKQGGKWHKVGAIIDR